jgi:hypothetical protein
MSRGRAYRLLVLLPSLSLLVGVPFANHVHRYVLGLPFLLFWIVGCVLLTSAVMATIAALDARHEAAAPPTPAPPAQPTPERPE